MEHQPLGGGVHQLELHNAERKEVHSQQNGRQQPRTGQPQLLQVKCRKLKAVLNLVEKPEHLNVYLSLFFPPQEP